MPSALTLQVTRDTLTPALRQALAAAKKRQPILRAAGEEIVALARRAFSEPALRQRPWPPKRDGQPSNLTQRGALARSIRITTVSDAHVSVGTDCKYAAIHQFGGVIRGKPLLVFTIAGKTYAVTKVVLPARPYLPFTKDGKLIPAAEAKVRATIEAAVAQQMRAR